MQADPVSCPSVSLGVPTTRDTTGSPYDIYEKPVPTFPISKCPAKKPKPPPLRLDAEPYYWPILNPLVEFATIATSPQSPLVQNATSEDVFVDVMSREQPYVETASTMSAGARESDRRLGSTCSSPYSPSVSADSLSLPATRPNDLTLLESPQYNWSTSLWQRLKQRSLNYVNVIDPPDCKTTACTYTGSAVTQRGKTAGVEEQRYPTSSLFRPYTMKETSLNDHTTPGSRPLGREQTWPPHMTSSFFTDTLPLSHRGGITRDLFLEDLCIPLKRSSSEVEVTPSSKSDVLLATEPATAVLFDLDSAAKALSSMAKRKEEHKKYHHSKLTSEVRVVTKTRKPAVARAKKNKSKNDQVVPSKRPMNAFMLFAKRYRVEITQKHPGKDNRAISVILGDNWRSLSNEDRKSYIVQAKVLAEEHKRIYPDCWKRKRTSQLSSSGGRKC